MNVLNYLISCSSPHLSKTIVLTNSKLKEELVHIFRAPGGKAHFPAQISLGIA